MNAIPTGFSTLDTIIGSGGYPAGRVVELFGPDSYGKAILAMRAIASCQAAGGVVAFIDAEHALDPNDAARMGVKLDQLLVAQPDDGEQALNIIQQLATSGAVDMIVVGSVAAIAPDALRIALRALTARPARTCLMIITTYPMDDVRYYASLRLNVRATLTGAMVKVEKNKLAPGWLQPFQEVEIGS